jgi:hypothetical protein
MDSFHTFRLLAGAGTSLDWVTACMRGITILSLNLSEIIKLFSVYLTTSYKCNVLIVWNFKVDWTDEMQAM